MENKQLLSALQRRCHIYITCYKHDVEYGESPTERLSFYEGLLDDYDNTLKTLYYDFDLIDDDTYRIGTAMVREFSDELIEVYVEKRGR